MLQEYVAQELWPEVWFCRDDPTGPFKNSYWLRYKKGRKQIKKKRQRYMNPDGRTWGNKWCEVSAPLAWGKVADLNSSTNRSFHEEHGPFGSGEMGPNMWNDHTYRAYHDGPPENALTRPSTSVIGSQVGPRGGHDDF